MIFIFKMLISFVFAMGLLALLPMMNHLRETNDLSVIRYQLKRFQPKEPKKEIKKPEEKVQKEVEKTLQLDSSLIPTPEMELNQPVIKPQLGNGMGFGFGQMGKMSFSKPTDLDADQKVKVVRGGQLLYDPKPVLSLKAKRMGLSGLVQVKFLVNTNGLTENVQVIQSDHELLSHAVIKAVEKYRFQPYVNDKEQEVAVTIVREFRFEKN